MKTTLSVEALQPVTTQLQKAGAEFAIRYPGEAGQRQPAHVVYGGAHLFRAEIVARLGSLACQALNDYAPDFITLAKAAGLPGAELLPATPELCATLIRQFAHSPDTVKADNPAAWLAGTVYTRVRDKLTSEPVEDFRVDFEDGYGIRPDAEEDGHAVKAAQEMARGMAGNTLPPFIGIRVKPLTVDLSARSLRTLDLFITTLTEDTGGKLPDGFVVTLSKVSVPEQVAALAAVLTLLEQRLNLPGGALRLEMMIETAQAIINSQGECNLPLLLAAAGGRCVAAHFGAYDYTASCNITAAEQQMQHPACDFARQMMQVALAGTGIRLSDGATSILPIAPHRATPEAPLTSEQLAINRTVIHHAWRLHYDNIRHALRTGFYQGWDLHPAQLPIRYAATYGFFLAGQDATAERLRNFVDRAAQATRVGNVFDDAATGQGLLNYFLRAISCGAIAEADVQALTGLTPEEIRAGSFVKILKNRS